MLFCQFSKLNSLRDVCNGLKSTSENLNHLGLQGSPCKSSLSCQNKNRDWQLFQAYYFNMLDKLHGMACFQKTRYMIKSKILLLDYDGCLSVYMNMTDSKTHDTKAVKELRLHAESVVVADRAYMDFDTLWRWHQGGSWFVVRLKTSVKFHRRAEKPLPEHHHGHILLDEHIV